MLSGAGRHLTCISTTSYLARNMQSIKDPGVRRRHLPFWSSWRTPGWVGFQAWPSSGRLRRSRIWRRLACGPTTRWSWRRTRRVDQAHPRMYLPFVTFLCFLSMFMLQATKDSRRGRPTMTARACVCVLVLFGLVFLSRCSRIQSAVAVVRFSVDLRAR